MDSGRRVSGFVEWRTRRFVAHCILFMPERKIGCGQQAGLEDKVTVCEIFGDDDSSMQSDGKKTIVEHVNLPLNDCLLVVEFHGLTGRS